MPRQRPVVGYDGGLESVCLSVVPGECLTKERIASVFHHVLADCVSWCQNVMLSSNCNMTDLQGLFFSRVRISLMDKTRDMVHCNGGMDQSEEEFDGGNRLNKHLVHETSVRAHGILNSKPLFPG